MNLNSLSARIFFNDFLFGFVGNSKKQQFIWLKINANERNFYALPPACNAIW